MNILDNIIVWTPKILHFKVLGMRNLQYEMRICQKSHNKVRDPNEEEEDPHPQDFG